ncbi:MULTISPECIES: MCE family protein [unclassified Saccharopolyspora]|uniref:MCE family protein n=1 Tax=unclassified Saccharopolyspora TaxID=2646250 RepID=UPI001CD4CB25|nr:MULTISPECIES: MCE family protein [unclassified Saccharopolyspora]MCA1186997.1 MCE family protein [Saccharopolyspora sp. 6T]MCA1195619.1 MCE family protein [Saccharopolyspora sp. 6V]MCA1280134.1 MCE family protein [Saccharopolyspora sp. 7B]
MRRRSAWRDDPLVTGGAGILVLLLVLGGVIAVPQLSFLWRTREYTAEFANAAGLTADAQVHVAGVPAGRVTGLELAGDRVRVVFRLDAGQRLGTATSASVRLATVMGARYLAVEPAGAGRIDAGAVIPLDRTRVPYSLDELGAAATGIAEELDLGALREMMRTAGEAMPDDPELVGRALDGIAGAAALVDRHDEQLDALLDGARGTTDALVRQQDVLVRLLGDADLVVRTLTERRDVVLRLIDDVDALSARLDEFLGANSAKLGPLLGDLREITAALHRDEQAIATTIATLGPAGRSLANATGNGSWGDVAGPAGPLPDNLLCLAGLLEGCR